MRRFIDEIEREALVSEIYDECWRRFGTPQPFAEVLDVLLLSAAKEGVPTPFLIYDSTVQRTVAPVRRVVRGSV